MSLGVEFVATGDRIDPLASYANAIYPPRGCPSPSSHAGLSVPSPLIPFNETYHRITEWAATTHNALAKESSFPPSSYKDRPMSPPLPPLPPLSECPDDGRALFSDPLELSPSTTTSFISDVLAHGSQDISVFQQRWDTSFNSSQYTPGRDSIKEAFVIAAKAQEALLRQTALLEVLVGQTVVELQSKMRDLIRRRVLLENTFRTHVTLEAWVSMHSPEVNICRIEGEHFGDQAALEGGPTSGLVSKSDDFITQHIPARCIGATFIRDPSIILASQFD